MHLDKSMHSTTPGPHDPLCCSVDTPSACRGIPHRHGPQWHYICFHLNPSINVLVIGRDGMLTSAATRLMTLNYRSELPQLRSNFDSAVHDKTDINDFTNAHMLRDIN